MPTFNKALSGRFIDALAALSQREGWWRDVLADKTLVIALRGKHLNVYWQGQSLFKVAYARGNITASTHPKYLIDPDLSAAVSFDGSTFRWDEATSSRFLTHYEGVRSAR